MYLIVLGIFQRIPGNFLLMKVMSTPLDPTMNIDLLEKEIGIMNCLNTSMSLLLIFVNYMIYLAALKNITNTLTSNVYIRVIL